jgi:hypothetical protein
MTTTAAVDRRVKQIRAEEKRSAGKARREKSKNRRAQAERDVAAEQRAAERAVRKKIADQVELEIRKRSPYAEIHAAGKVIRIELAAADSTVLGFAIEAVRRACYQAAHRFQEKITGSRAAGRAVAEVDWIKTEWGAEAGLLYANRRGLVSVKSDT